jgi:hypothetical protein
MTFAPFDILPGIYTEASDREAFNLKRWKSGSNVRAWKGYMEKIGGWTKMFTTAMVGVSRAILNWESLDGFNRYMAFGTHLKLYINDGTNFSDITPLASSGTEQNNPFATVSGTSEITVTHASHDRQVGDFVNYSGASAVAGLSMNGEWQVTSVDVNTYTFDHTGTANATTTGGGASVAYQYPINGGLVDTVIGSGWGASTWGTGTWGTPRTGTKLQECRTWSLDKWGEDLIASPKDGPIYVWVQTGGVSTRAVLISQAPSQNNVVLVSPEDRHMIAFGAFEGSIFDPMLIRWCSSEDYTDWTASATNTAGDKRLDSGNEIVAALRSRGVMVILTDTSVYEMAFDGSSFVFSFKNAGENVGCIGPKAACDIDGTVYYMGRGQFMSYNGYLNPLACDVQSYVFDDINLTQRAKVFCARNKAKNEVMWFYCSAASSEIDRCVALSTNEDTGEKTWWTGTVARTCFSDSPSFGDLPVGTSSDGYLYQHETGVDADGAALPYSLESYDFELPGMYNYQSGESSGQGESVVFVKRFIPDFRRVVGSHEFVLSGRKKPNGQVVTKAAVAFDATTDTIDDHIRARQISMLLRSSAIGADISMGGWRADITRMGKR